jgi:hypothetical protein
VAGFCIEVRPINNARALGWAKQSETLQLNRLLVLSVGTARKAPLFTLRNRNLRSCLSAPVENNIAIRLTGSVNHGVLFKVNCFSQNPSAAMRGGFLRWGVAINNNYRHSRARSGAA